MTQAALLAVGEAIERLHRQLDYVHAELANVQNTLAAAAEDALMADAVVWDEKPVPSELAHTLQAGLARLDAHLEACSALLARFRSHY